MTIPFSVFKRVLPLPSENWSDFADIWFCHNHGGEGHNHWLVFLVFIYLVLIMKYFYDYDNSVVIHLHIKWILSFHAVILLQNLFIQNSEIYVLGLRTVWSVDFTSWLMLVRHGSVPSVLLEISWFVEGVAIFWVLSREVNTTIAVQNRLATFHKLWTLEQSIYLFVYIIKNILSKN